MIKEMLIYNQRKDILETKTPYQFFLEILEETIENILELYYDEKKMMKIIKMKLKKSLKII